MSAWYIFSSLGFYPVCPGSEWYNLGSPNVKNATVNLPNGKSLEIIASNADAQNVYVKKVSFNNKEITDYRISHFELIKGGKLIFEMSPTP